MLERFILGIWDVKVRAKRLTELSGNFWGKKETVFVYRVPIILFRKEKKGKEEGREGRADKPVGKANFFLIWIAGGIYNVVSRVRGMMDSDVLIVILCKMFLWWIFLLTIFDET